MEALHTALPVSERELERQLNLPHRRAGLQGPNSSRSGIDPALGISASRNCTPRAGVNEHIARAVCCKSPASAGNPRLTLFESEVRAVEDVEELRPELQGFSFSYSEVLEDGEVRADQPRPDQGLATEVAEIAPL